MSASVTEVALAFSYFSMNWKSNALTLILI